MNVTVMEQWWAGLDDRVKDGWCEAWGNNSKIADLLGTLPDRQGQVGGMNGPESWISLIGGGFTTGKQGTTYQMRTPFNEFIGARFRERRGHDGDDE